MLILYTQKIKYNKIIFAIMNTFIKISIIILIALIIIYILYEVIKIVIKLRNKYLESRELRVIEKGQYSISID